MTSTKTYYAVIAVGQETPIDDMRRRLIAILGEPPTFRLLSYKVKPSGIVTHQMAEVKFMTDAGDDRLDLIEAAEIED
ncbi:hypothetical protein [Xanthobacter agilis]|uniref:hypothetical protein n=1 Tax=Xanthobacter agilis TaxID=47492 RepID=UPI00372750FF